MNAEELSVHIDREIEHLQREFAGTIPGEEVAQICWEQVDLLLETAAFDDFIPLLVHRRAREALIEAESSPARELALN